jgi:hypothetical protein
MLGSLVPGGSSIDRETVYDIVVNLIPMGILALMDLLFIVLNPWGIDLWIIFWVHVLTLFPLLVLGIVTYVSAAAVSRDEKRGEASGD